MKFQYSAWDLRKERKEQLIKDLFKLFKLLLAKTAGDAEQALEWLDHIGKKQKIWNEDFSFEDFKKLLERDGQTMRGKGGKVLLTPKGEKGLRQEAFLQIFSQLGKGAPGDHRTQVAGQSHEKLPETRAYRFGDELWSIAHAQTLNNAVRRSMRSTDLSANTVNDDLQIEIQSDDVEVYDTEFNTGCATALLVDCSHSMVLYGEDRMTPARQVAMGMVELIRTRYPKDRLHVIAFGDDAREVPLKEVPYLNYGPYHTNTRAALQLARKILLRVRSPNRQIFLITDGKPTVLDENGRRLIDSAPWLNPRIANRTLEEGAMCRRKNIPITTFMVTEDPILVGFIEDLTRINNGRAYFTGLGKLGQYLLVDYIKNRRRSVR